MGSFNSVLDMGLAMTLLLLRNPWQWSNHPWNLAQVEMWATYYKRYRDWRRTSKVRHPQRKFQTSDLEETHHLFQEQDTKGVHLLLSIFIRHRLPHCMEGLPITASSSTNCSTDQRILNHTISTSSRVHIPVLQTHCSLWTHHPTAGRWHTTAIIVILIHGRLWMKRTRWVLPRVIIILRIPNWIWFQ